MSSTKHENLPQLGSAILSLRTGPFGSAVHKEDYVRGGCPLINPSHIISGKIVKEDNVSVSREKATELAAYRLRHGDVIIGRRGEMGRCAVVAEGEAGWLIGTGSMALTPSSELTSEYLYRFLSSPKTRLLLEAGAVGSTMANLSQKTLLGLRIAIPSKAEQRRIVAKLDALTARIARARTELVRVPKLVQRIKQHALAICFASASDRAPILLGTILKNVQAGKNLRCEERPPHPGELGVVKVSAVTWGRFDPTKAKTLPSDYIPPEAARIRMGDLLMSRANTIELVGAVALVERAPSDLFLSDKVLRLVVPEDAKRWIQWFLRSPSGREQIERMATGNQLSMRNLSQDALRRIELPFPNAATRLRACLSDLRA